MAQFSGDIAGMLEVFAVGIGLVVLYYAKKESSSLLKAAGIVFLAGGILGGVCTGYYWFKYQSRGYFDMPTHGSMMKNMMMHKRMMQHMNCKPGQKCMQNMPMGQKMDDNQTEHKEHHPDN